MGFFNSGAEYICFYQGKKTILLSISKIHSIKKPCIFHHLKNCTPRNIQPYIFSIYSILQCLWLCNFTLNLLEIYSKSTRSLLTVPSFLQVFSNKLICFSMFLYHFQQFFSTKFIATLHQLHINFSQLHKN